MTEGVVQLLARCIRLHEENVKLKKTLKENKLAEELRARRRQADVWRKKAHQLERELAFNAIGRIR